MTRPVVYYWPPSEGGGAEQGIALLENNANILEGNNLVLFSNTTPGVFSYANIINPLISNPTIGSNVVRSIDISSVDDNSDVTFVINGIGSPIDGLGNPTRLVGPITEDLVGPTAGATVTSANIYTIINSITVTEANATNVQVGYGPNGITNYYLLDCNRTSIQGYSSTYSVQYIPSPSVTMDTTVYVSVNNPEIPTINGAIDSFGLINGQQLAFMPAFSYEAMAAPSASFFNYLYTGFQTIWVQVSNTNSDSMLFTLMQQGI